MAYAVTATHKLDRPIIQALDASSSTAVHDVGYEVTGTDGKVYLYVLTDASTIVASAGYPAHWMTGTTTGEVTSDISDTGTRGSAFAGVFCCGIALADEAYCWIQTKGFAADCSISTDVAASDKLCARTDYMFEAVGEGDGEMGSSRIVAIAMEAVDGDTGDIVML